MSGRRPQQLPNPSRFDDFIELKDKSGFVVRSRNGSIEFYYDKFGGWFDEYGNYYDKNAKSCKPSQESQRFWEEIKQQYEKDDLVAQYEQNLEYEDSGSEYSHEYYDDHEELENSFKEPSGNYNHQYKSNNVKPQITPITRSNIQTQPQPQPQPKPKTDEKVKQEQKQEPKVKVNTQNTQKPQEQIQQVQKPQQTDSKPTAEKKDIDVLVTGLEKSVTEQIFNDWILIKLKTKDLPFKIRSKEVGAKRDIKLTFNSIDEARSFFENIKIDDKGKVSFKGKYQLTFKIL